MGGSQVTGPGSCRKGAGDDEVGRTERKVTEGRSPAGRGATPGAVNHETCTGFCARAFYGLQIHEVPLQGGPGMELADLGEVASIPAQEATRTAVQDISSPGKWTRPFLPALCSLRERASGASQLRCDPRTQQFPEAAILGLSQVSGQAGRSHPHRTGESFCSIGRAHPPPRPVRTLSYLDGLGNLNPLGDGHVTGVKEGLALQHRVDDSLVRAGRPAGGRTRAAPTSLAPTVPLHPAGPCTPAPPSGLGSIPSTAPSLPSTQSPQEHVP